MKSAIILHGKPDKEEYNDPDQPSPSNAHWIPWLQKQLIINGIQSDTPEVPHAYEANWDVWCKEVGRFALDTLDPETILVGHSTGAGFWLRYLSEHKDLNVGKVVLVAPWIDPDRTNAIEFFDFEMDPRLVERTNGITIFSSDNDLKDVRESVGIIRSKVPGIKLVEFHNYGHFLYTDMKTEKFPELLQNCLSGQV